MEGSNKGSMNKIIKIVRNIFYLISIIILFSCSRLDTTIKPKTPTLFIKTTFGEKQYSWLSKEDESFIWPSKHTLFFDWRKRHNELTEMEWSGLDCDYAITSGKSVLTEWLKKPINEFSNTNNQSDSRQFSIMLIDFFHIALNPAVCSGNPETLDLAVELMYKLAKNKAFMDLTYLSWVNKWKINVRNNQNQKKLGIDYDKLLIGDILGTRETISNMLLVWNIYGNQSKLVKKDKVIIYEWLKKLIEKQNFSYAEYPLDCPSYRTLKKQEDWEGGSKMTVNQFEECINIGTSRAVVEALWALTSGDKKYALNALNTYMMFLNMHRSDGSHIMETVRDALAHYKSVLNISMMVIIAEVYKAAGYNIYSSKRNGKTIFHAMKFLSDSALNHSLIEKYSKEAFKFQKQFHSASHWLLLTRDSDSIATDSIKIQIKNTKDQSQAFAKIFSVWAGDPERRFGKNYFVPLLPFTAMYSPSNYIEYASNSIKPKIRRRIDTISEIMEEMFLTDWSVNEDKYLGRYKIFWYFNGKDPSTIKYVSGKQQYSLYQNKEFQGMEYMNLTKGKGEILVGGKTFQPDEKLRKNIKIAYIPNGNILFEGKLDLWEQGRSYSTSLSGNIDEGKVEGIWHDGDKIIVKFFKIDKNTVEYKIDENIEAKDRGLKNKKRGPLKEFDTVIILYAGHKDDLFKYDAFLGMAKNNNAIKLLLPYTRKNFWNIDKPRLENCDKKSYNDVAIYFEINSKPKINPNNLCLLNALSTVQRQIFLNFYIQLINKSKIIFNKSIEESKDQNEKLFLKRELNKMDIKNIGFIMSDENQLIDDKDNGAESYRPVYQESDGKITIINPSAKEN